MRMKGILGCVFVVFVKRGYLPVWMSFVVANNGTPAVLGKFSFISMCNHKGTPQILQRRPSGQEKRSNARGSLCASDPLCTTLPIMQLNYMK